MRVEELKGYNELKDKWYKRGIKAGQSDTWMDLVDTLEEDYERYRGDVSTPEDLVDLGIEGWEETEHFRILYEAKMEADARELATKNNVSDTDVVMDVLGDLKGAFWEGYLDGLKARGVDIYEEAKKVMNQKKASKKEDTMRYKLYESSGPYLDKYTLVVDGDVYTFSANPDHPQGVAGYWGKVEELRDSLKGEKEITLNDLPPKARKWVEEKLKEYGIEVKSSVKSRGKRVALKKQSRSLRVKSSLRKKAGGTYHPLEDLEVFIGKSIDPADGKWVNLSEVTEEEFYKIVDLVSDGGRYEVEITDVSCPDEDCQPICDNLLYMNVNEVFDFYTETLAYLDEDECMKLAFLLDYGEDLDEALTNIEDVTFLGCLGTEEELGDFLIEEGYFDLSGCPENILHYIDSAAIARDAIYNGEIHEYNGCYFIYY